MPLDLVCAIPGNYTIQDSGIPADRPSVIRNAGAAVVFSFVQPLEALTFTTVPGVNSVGAADMTIGDLANAAASPDSLMVQSVHTNGDEMLVSNGAMTEVGNATPAAAR